MDSEHLGKFDDVFLRVKRQLEGSKSTVYFEQIDDLINKKRRFRHPKPSLYSYKIQIFFIEIANLLFPKLQGFFIYLTISDLQNGSLFENFGHREENFEITAVSEGRIVKKQCFRILWHCFFLKGKSRFSSMVSAHSTAQQFFHGDVYIEIFVCMIQIP